MQSHVEKDMSRVFFKYFVKFQSLIAPKAKMKRKDHENQLESVLLLCQIYDYLYFHKENRNTFRIKQFFKFNKTIISINI